MSLGRSVGLEIEIADEQRILAGAVTEFSNFGRVEVCGMLTVQ